MIDSASYEGDLIVMAERGSRIEPPPPPEPVSTPSTDREDHYPFLVRLSPDYAHDHTLFIITSGRLYRSRDDGQTWVRLRGGLPDRFIIRPKGLAISPNFNTDRTLYLTNGPDLFRSIND